MDYASGMKWKGKESLRCRVATFFNLNKKFREKENRIELVYNWWSFTGGIN